MVGLSQIAAPNSLIAANWAPYWHFSGVMHPAVSHFPIALLMVAALVESWSVIRRQRRPLTTTLVCLYIGAAAAVLASVLGWANADASGEKGQTFNLHKWLGIAVAVVALSTVVMSLLVRRERGGKTVVWGYRGGVFVAAGLVGLVGSLGGKLVHGETYYQDALAALQQELSEAAPNAPATAVAEAAVVAESAVASAAETIGNIPADTVAPAATAPVEPTQTIAAAQPTAVDVAAPSVVSATGFGGGQIDYARDIEPILQANCVKCHNETKKKGGYRLDAFERVFAAGQSGTAPVMPGKSDESLLVKVIEGRGDFADSIMPPKGNPLSFQQIALIRRWIDEGAQSSSP